MSSRTHRGNFEKGASGNPAGRPRGSRNQATLALDRQLAEAGPILVQKLIEQAAGGNMQAMRLCLDRIIPRRRDCPVDLPLPPVKNAQDVATAFTEVTSAVATGQITPAEGESLAQILTLQGEALLAGDLEERIEALQHSEETYKVYREEIAAHRQEMLEERHAKAENARAETTR